MLGNFPLGLKGSRIPLGDPPPPFDPSQISGCIAYYNGDTLAGSNGDPLDIWLDSAFGNNMTQSNSSLRPFKAENVTNMQNGVRFNGSEYFDIGDMQIKDASSIFAAVKTDGADAATYSAFLSKGTGDIAFLQWSINGLSLARADVEFMVSENTDGSANWQVVGYTWDGATATLYRNGGVPASAPYDVSNLSNNTSGTVGKEGPLLMSGYIMSMAVYNRALDSSEVAQVNSFFTSKYGII